MKLKLYDLYCDGDLVGSCLWWSEVKEIIREQRKYHSERGHTPTFELIEV